MLLMCHTEQDNINYLHFTTGYLGCYLDDKNRILMPDKQIKNNQMTIEMCINHCNGYNYAAPQVIRV